MSRVPTRNSSNVYTNIAPVRSSRLQQHDSTAEDNERGILPSLAISTHYASKPSANSTLNLDPPPTSARRPRTQAQQSSTRSHASPRIASAPLHGHNQDMTASLARGIGMSTGDGSMLLGPLLCADQSTSLASTIAQTIESASNQYKKTFSPELNNNMTFDSTQFMKQGSLQPNVLLGTNTQLQQQLSELIKVNQLLRINLAISNKQLQTNKTLETRVSESEAVSAERLVEITELKRKIREANSKMKDLTVERTNAVSIMNQAIRDAEDARREADEKIDDYAAQIQEMDECISALRAAQQVVSAPVVTSSINPEAYSDAMREIQELRSRLTLALDSRDQMAKAHAHCGLNSIELASLRKDVGDARKVFAAHEQLQDQVMELEEQLTQSRRREHSLEEILAQRQTSTAEWQDKLLAEQLKHLGCKDLIDSLKSELDIAKQKVVVFDSAVKVQEKVSQEIKEVMQIKVTEAVQQKEDNSRELKLLSERLQVVLTENDTLRKQHAAMHAEVESRLERMTQMSKHLNDAKLQTKTVTDANLELKAIIKTLERQAEKDKVEQRRLLQELDSMTKAKSGLDADIIIVQGEKAKMFVLSEKRLREIEGLQVKLDLMHKSQLIQADAMRAMEDRLATYHEVVAQLEDVREKYTQSRASLERLTIEYQSLQKTHALVSDDLKRVSHLHSDLEIRSSTLEMRNAEVEQKLAEMSQELTSMKTDYLRVVSEVMKHEKTLLAERMRNVDLRNDCNHTTDIVRDLQTQSDTYATMVSELQTDLNTMRSRCEQLQEASSLGMVIGSYLLQTFDLVKHAPAAILPRKLSQLSQSMSTIAKGGHAPSMTALQWPDGFCPFPLLSDVPVDKSPADVSIRPRSVASPPPKHSAAFPPPIMTHMSSAGYFSPPMQSPMAMRKASIPGSDTDAAIGDLRLALSNNSNTSSAKNCVAPSSPPPIIPSPSNENKTKTGVRAYRSELAFNAAYMRHIIACMCTHIASVSDMVTNREKMQAQLQASMKSYETLAAAYNSCPKSDWSVQLSNVVEQLGHTNDALKQMQPELAPGLNMTSIKGPTVPVSVAYSSLNGVSMMSYDDAHEHTTQDAKAPNFTLPSALNALRSLRSALADAREREALSQESSKAKVTAMRQGYNEIKNKKKSQVVGDKESEFVLSHSPLTQLNLQVNALALNLEAHLSTGSDVASSLNVLNTNLNLGFGQGIKAARDTLRVFKALAKQRPSWSVLIDELCQLVEYARDTNHMLGHIGAVLGRATGTLNKASLTSLTSEHALVEQQTQKEDDENTINAVGFEPVDIVVDTSTLGQVKKTKKRKIKSKFLLKQTAASDDDGADLDLLMNGNDSSNSTTHTPAVVSTDEVIDDDDDDVSSRSASTLTSRASTATITTAASSPTSISTQKRTSTHVVEDTPETDSTERMLAEDEIPDGFGILVPSRPVTVFANIRPHTSSSSPTETTASVVETPRASKGLVITIDDLSVIKSQIMCVVDYPKNGAHLKPLALNLSVLLEAIQFLYNKHKASVNLSYKDRR